VERLAQRASQVDSIWTRIHEKKKRKVEQGAGASAVAKKRLIILCRLIYLGRLNLK
jgi:hypothetical protein